MHLVDTTLVCRKVLADDLNEKVVIPVSEKVTHAIVHLWIAADDCDCVGQGVARDDD